MPTSSPLSLRLTRLVTALALVVFVASWGGPELSAQKPDAKPPVKKTDKVEEEEGKSSSKVPHVDDDDPGPELDKLRRLIEEKDRLGADQQANKLAAVFQANPEVRSAVVRFRVGEIERLLEGELFVQARQKLEQLEKLFRDSRGDKGVGQLRERLQKKAESLLQGINEVAAKDRTKAIAIVRGAESIWPESAVVRKWRRELKLDTILWVGVRQLPVNMSPGAAVTDVERQAVELLFESLVKPVANPALGGYQPVLTAGMPRLVPLGREFQLATDAHWYAEPFLDPRGGQGQLLSQPVTVHDVYNSVQWYRNPPRSPEWTLFGDPQMVGSQQLRLDWHQGLLDPLALITFKVLPVDYMTQKGMQQDSLDFAQRPVGSGPYHYQGRKTEDGVEYAQFVANPTYGQRSGNTGLPHIREIRFFQSKDRINDFKRGNLHLLLDLSREELQELRSPKVKPKDVTIEALPNRRIYMLAVNLRNNPRLGNRLQQPDLRRALAKAINRDEILNTCFRPEPIDEKSHRSLNGPFPPGSWACTTKGVDSVLFSPLVAADLLKKNPDLAPSSAVQLLHAKADKDVCEKIRAQVQANAPGIRLELKECTPAELYKAVELDHNYELAYYSFDYANDWYWLWPLLDPESADMRGGRNFLGKVNDSALETPLKEALRHRDFTKVQSLMHDVHKRFQDTMPFIPLWQLDTYVAIQEKLKTVPPVKQLDPLLVFPHVEGWKLDK